MTLTARRTASDVKPEYWPTGRDRNCFAALVEVAIDTLGRPEPRTARLVRASDPGYAAAVMAIIPSLRFEPARMAGRPVRQIYELREVLLIRRQRQQVSGTRGTRGAGIMPGSMSEAPTGAELPTLQSLGSVC